MDMTSLKAFFFLLHKEGLKLTFHPPCAWGQNPGCYTASKVDHSIKDPDVIVGQNQY
jgi:hypothetical protein